MAEGEGFRIIDKRAGARAAASPAPSGLILGQSVSQAKNLRTANTAADRALAAGRQGPIPTDPTESRQMQVQRLKSSRMGSYVGGGGGGGMNINFATQRPQDPFFYWQQNNLPYDFNDPRHLLLLRQLCRHIYKAHSVMASAIDIYSKWPLIGLEFECLAAETRVVTDQGIKRIADLAGGTHRVITSTGNWVAAEFKSYGVRPLRKITVKQNRREQTIYATEGHRWYVQESSIDRARGRRRLREETTDALRPGDRLEVMYATNRVRSTHPSAIGVAHGITYGDGSIKGRSRNEGYVNLYGDKNIDLLKYFPEPNIRKWQPEGVEVEAVTVYDLPGYFKALPNLSESTSYLYGFLSGWFAADGTVSKKGECILYSASRDDIDYAQTICQRLGVRTAMPYEATRTNSKVEGDHTMWMLPLDAGSLTGEFFAVAEHRERWTEREARGMKSRRGAWTVVSIEETDRIEEVYCAEVPSTESFVLEGNLLTGNCKDKALTEFYTDLFFDQLDYEEYLPSVLHEYWTVGEAFPLGSFNETLGVWEDDELLNPDDVFVEKSPFVKEPNLYIRLPESLRRILTTGNPPEQYHALMRSYPELQAYAQENTRMPVSNVLLKHLRFKADNFATRGLPIMYRALRPLMQEEMMNAAQDAIADRLYTPLVLAKLGASATDLGTEEPWVPTQDQISNFEVALDAALAADFRVLTTHFAVDMESVFGRETMPNFDADFDRLTEKQLQAFGLSKTMLSGAGSGETYAADALNRDLISQLLSSAQRYIRKFVRDRMLVVAEAQEHYDYEVRGGKRYPIMEEVLEVDPETGEQRIVEQPKLLVPELKMKTMNLKDEQAERDFLEALRSQGVPISQKRRLINVDIDLETEIEQVAEEQIEQAVEAQRVRKRTYLRLKAENLPIPQDLKDDFEPRAKQPDGQDAKTPGEQQEDAPSRVPLLGVDGEDTTALAPNEDALAVPPGYPLGEPAGPAGEVEAGPDHGPGTPGRDAPVGEARVIPLPRSHYVRTRPEESDEMRAGMPRSSSRVPEDVVLPEPPIMKNAFQEDLYRPDTDEDGKPVPWQAKEGGIIQGPRHIGMRRFSTITRDTVIGEEPEDDQHEGAS